VENNAIEIVNLRKSFDGGRDFVLDGINLTIPPSKITMIIGFSGTGKSVLMKHILGLMRPTSGEIRVLGTNLSEMKDRDLLKFRMKLGVMFQYSALFDDMTALENAMFPLIEHRKDLKKSEIKEIASEKMNQAGLESKHFDKLPSEMSGGMRKRAALARAMALDPEIMLYDEPTTGLDPILTEMVDDLIYKTHYSRSGKTSVIISHDLHAAFRIGDHVVMLHNGGVLMEGVPDDFLKSQDPLVRKFVDTGIRKKDV
jgi:phospholipid/cholesterol/gamma-HCH transport system ATP-binding protein